MSGMVVTKSEQGGAMDVNTPRHPAAARPVVAFVEAVNRDDLNAAIAQLARNALHHGRVANYRPDGVRLVFSMLRRVFPDLRLDIRELKVDGNRVITRLVATGTHTGSFLGRPPTGRPVAWESVDIAEVESFRDCELEPVGGDDVESSGTADIERWRVVNRFWDLWNDPRMLKELGFVPGIMC